MNKAAFIKNIQKSQIIIISAVITISSVVLSSCRSAEHYKSKGETTEIRIKVDGIRSKNGKLMLAMYHDENNFTKNLRPAAAVQRMIFGKSTDVVFKGAFSPGEFSIAVFHDEDGDGTMKTSSGGIPLEGFGFSGNPPLSRGKPGWKETKFTVESGSHSETIQMIYID
ncbi:MAG: DUF2141 domain-containing protein [Spirochaetia bacterium]|nr:DUF2141 domain-containing protein [Spirochaetia bacterium]